MCSRNRGWDIRGQRLQIARSQMREQVGAACTKLFDALARQGQSVREVR